MNQSYRMRSTDITMMHIATSNPHISATNSCSVNLTCFMNTCVSDSILLWYSRNPLPDSEQ
jgi:hypothetical protein